MIILIAKYFFITEINYKKKQTLFFVSSILFNLKALYFYDCSTYFIINIINKYLL